MNTAQIEVSWLAKEELIANWKYINIHHNFGKEHFGYVSPLHTDEWIDTFSMAAVIWFDALLHCHFSVSICQPPTRTVLVFLFFSLIKLQSHFASARLFVQNHSSIFYSTGLDPAFPLYVFSSPSSRLSSSDANFVDIIHTDAGLLGYPWPLGHADFFPNGGTPLQPGCARQEISKNRWLSVVGKWKWNCICGNMNAGCNQHGRDMTNSVLIADSGLDTHNQSNRMTKNHLRMCITIPNM